MKKHTCLIAGVLCCALATAPALAFPTASVTSHTFSVVFPPAEPNGMQRVPFLTVTVKFNATNPDTTTSYVNVNDDLQLQQWENGPYMGVNNKTTALAPLPPGFNGPVIADFRDNPVANNATYTSTATVNGVKTQPPYPIGAGPIPLTSDTKTQTVSWV